ncbi:hypothetical protein [Streptomyces mirabilis]|uniref:hypothetical protein n=1 Tax=Streptomyces mirabilis TaxID=68239 RepID=UPI0036C82000
MTADDRPPRATIGEALGFAIWTMVVLAGLALIIGTPILNATGHPFHPFGDDGTNEPAKPAVSSAPAPKEIDNPALPDDETEGYWYCWDTGDLAPHHLDHWVPNDHLCTWGELRHSGVTG